MKKTGIITRVRTERGYRRYKPVVGRLGAACRVRCIDTRSRRKCCHPRLNDKRLLFHPHPTAYYNFLPQTYAYTLHQSSLSFSSPKKQKKQKGTARAPRYVRESKKERRTKMIAQKNTEALHRCIASSSLSALSLNINRS